MLKTRFRKYKGYIFLPNLSGSSYLSPVLETQSGSDPTAGSGRERPVPWGEIRSITGSPYPVSVAKLPPASHSFAWKRDCVRPEEPRPVEFNMNFDCHGKVLVIQTCTKLEFINSFKAGQAAVPALGGLFWLLLFHLFHYFVTYWCSDEFWEQRRLILRSGHAVYMRLSCSCCAKCKEVVPTISATRKLRKNKSTL